MAEGSVLIVDDTPDNVQVLRMMLRKRGYKITTANSAEEALQQLATKIPDVFLLDVSMPKMDGYELCRRLKQNPETRDVPVIFISALNQTHDKIRGFEVGGIDYITKPFETEEVVARVNSQVTLYQQRRELESLHQRDRERYEALSTAKDQFLSTASHDLKNPLGAIMGYASILRDLPHIREDEYTREAVENITYGARRMQRLIADLLDLVRMETGVGLNISRADVGLMITRVVQEMQVLAQQKNHTLKYQPPSPPVFLNLDEPKIGQVLMNLISNAIKYTPNGGTVEVRVQDDGRFVHLTVQDNGLGIPADALPKLFGKFFRVRTREHMAQEGTGLGLSIVKAIVEQHNGAVDVESTLKKGTRFIISLPHEASNP
jgi:two-component system, sensor histidine kinase and response regulator